MSCWHHRSALALAAIVVACGGGDKPAPEKPAYLTWPAPDRFAPDSTEEAARRLQPRNWNDAAVAAAIARATEHARAAGLVIEGAQIEGVRFEAVPWPRGWWVTWRFPTKPSVFKTIAVHMPETGKIEDHTYNCDHCQARPLAADRPYVSSPAWNDGALTTALDRARSHLKATGELLEDAGFLSAVFVATPRPRYWKLEWRIGSETMGPVTREVTVYEDGTFERASRDCYGNCPLPTPEPAPAKP